MPEKGFQNPMGELCGAVLVVRWDDGVSAWRAA